MINKPNKIIVHHTADSWGGRQFNKVNDWHRKRNFPKSSLGYFCGYHFFIEKDGTIIKARRISEEGAHTKGQNFTSIGIGLAGNFNKEMPTNKQKEALGNICLSLMKEYNIDIIRIYPHRKYKQTSCYGTKLDDKWAQYQILQHELSIIKKILLWLKVKLQYI